MRRHSTDGVSLGFGLVFLALAGWWLAARYVDIDIDVPNLDWIVPVALIALGLIGVVASLRRAGRRPEAEPTRPATAPGLAGGTEPVHLTPAEDPTPTSSAADSPVEPVTSDRTHPQP